MEMKACICNPTPPTPAGSWISPICFSILGENKGISCKGQEDPRNGIDTLPPTPAGHKGSLSTLHAWKGSCRTCGALCDFCLWEEIFAGTRAPKLCNHKHAGIQILRSFCCCRYCFGFFVFFFKSDPLSALCVYKLS